MCVIILGFGGEIMYIRELTVPEFDLFTKNYTYGSIYQTSNYGYIMNNQSFEPFVLGLVDNQNTVYAATLLLVEKNMMFKYAYAPRGFLIDYTNTQLVETFTKLLKKFCSKKDIIAVKLSPNIVKCTYQNGNVIPNPMYETTFHTLQKLGYFHFGYNHYFESLRPRFVGKIDLNKPYYMVFSQLKKNYRTKVRSASKKGIKIYRGDASNLNYLFLNEELKSDSLKYYQDYFNYFSNQNMIELYYAKLDTNAYLTYIKKKYEHYEKSSAIINQEMIEQTGKKRERVLNKKLVIDKKFDKYKKELVRATKLLREHPEGIIAACALIVKFRDEVYIIRDSFNKEIKDTNPKPLLMWKLLEKYCNQGYKYFNIGGMTDINYKNNKYKSLNQAKLNYSPIVYEYLGDLELVTNQALYFMYRQTAPLRNILKK